jgi:hypothetical protein
MRTYVRVPVYRFTITEYDVDQPWLVVSTEHQRVELPPDVDFRAWASGQWPQPRYRFELDPGQSTGWPGVKRR